jgi:hypothetical protein
MMRSDPLCALVVGVVLMLLVVLSCRLCRSGKSTPAATKPPRATRAPKPFAGLTRKPDCPACEQEARLQPSAAAPSAPLPRMLFTRGRRRHVETTGHFCPQATCAYHGRVGWGNIRANGHPNGRRWRQPEVPHQLCHFHSLRAAAKPVSAADRHAKKARKQRGRGGRPMARQLDQRTDPEAEVRRGSCRAVRCALTDEGHPPLAASGLTLHDRLTALAQRLERGTNRGRGPSPSSGCQPSSHAA